RGLHDIATLPTRRSADLPFVAHERDRLVTGNTRAHSEVPVKRGETPRRSFAGRRPMVAQTSSGLAQSGQPSACDRRRTDAVSLLDRKSTRLNSSHVKTSY